MSHNLEPYLPEDFDAFWQETVEEAQAVPIDIHRSWSSDFDLPGFIVEKLDFLSVGNRRVNGWIAHPPEAHELPAFLWIPPYGRESLLPNEYGTREGFVSMSLNFFGEDAFHQENYVRERGYFAEGAEDPHKWVFRRMFQDAYVAANVLRAQHEVDEHRVGAMGMSQGGGMSIWLGAWCKHIKAVCADMPFFCAVRDTLLHSVHRYPLKELTDLMGSIPLGEERVLNTVSYFDTVNQATHCHVPTHVTLGLKDPSCRPPNVRACYNALPGKKALTELDWGHDWHPSMIETNRQWLVENLG
ncbi:MAG: cephalosporin-C deacetylase [Fimbriimonadaceae bacterium]|jgi:cephalosporin-C deacetylase|nr:cephalosporin-C deacetylase [Fimbriimonadaceae bacterium]